MTSDRNFKSPRIGIDGVPRKVPEGKFLWHNHVQHCVGMPHGFNGFRYWHGTLPIDYREFECCECGVTDLTHYRIRGSYDKCVSVEQVMRNGRMR